MQSCLVCTGEVYYNSSGGGSLLHFAKLKVVAARNMCPFVGGFFPVFGVFFATPFSLQEVLGTLLATYFLLFHISSLPLFCFFSASVHSQPLFSLFLLFYAELFSSSIFFAVSLHAVL